MTRRSVAIAALLLAASVFVRRGLAEEFPTLQEAADRLRAATVTVRVAPATAATTAPGRESPATDDPSEPVTEGPAAARVLVSSGVLLAGGRVATFVNASGDVRIRITLPSGEQAEGQPRVVDHFSGLTLLATDQNQAAGIELAETVPAVGEWVLSAAGWGMEQPVLSFGILSGVDRSLRGAAFPPLLQCDLRTAASSSGAGLVDRHGRLIGIVVGTDREGERGGWTYAVDVGHVRRLLRAEQPDKVVMLRARRPVAGLVLGAGPEPNQVVVQRVTPGGPAEQAGIKQGDIVLAADGLNIRSVYQAVVPLLKKQAGDTMAFLVEQADGRRTIEVTLRGGVELPGPHFAGNLGLEDPRVEIARVAQNRFDVRDRRGGVRNLAMEPQQPDESAEEQPGVRLLQKALDQYTSLIERYREELQRRDREQAASRAVIESLQAEITELKQKLADPSPPSAASSPEPLPESLPEPTPLR